MISVEQLNLIHENLYELEHFLKSIDFALMEMLEKDRCKQCDNNVAYIRFLHEMGTRVFENVKKIAFDDMDG